MKISIITPTHDPRYLPELERSILDNDFTEWEWIILLNNGAQYTTTDTRIKIVPCPFVSDYVGALKNFACSLATGDILLEADHDDQLTPDCLSSVAEAFTDPEIGFVYSDCAHLGQFTPYSQYWGWKSYKYEWKGEQLTAMRSQPLFPGRLCNIGFAPDHVRAWRRSVYNEVGGHNPELPVCDDQDLTCRMFMVTKFKYIPRVLYIYQESEDQTFRQRQKQIEDLNWTIYDQYIHRVASRWAENNNLLKIDLCQTHEKKTLGYVAMNRYNSDIITNFESGFPIPRNSVGVILARDALCKFRGQMKIMSEIHRVLAPGGILLSATPSTDGRGAWQSPANLSFWNENSFWYYTREKQMLEIDNPMVHFRECRLTTRYPDDQHELTNQPYAIAHLEKIPAIL
jgi:SAM-dependent methyltransferase